MTLMLSMVFVLGVAGLLVGAESLVRGASRLAARTGLSPVVIGLTVVAFGTSAPELAVSIGATVTDDVDVAIGNIVGSNIANVLFVLGLAAFAGGSLVVAQRLVRIDVPIVIAVSVLVLVFSLDRKVGRLEGLVLVALLVAYLVWTVKSARAGSSKVVHSDLGEGFESERLGSPIVDVAYVVGGLVVLAAGARALVGSATEIATNLGVSEVVIGITVVALGTSLPEVATSVLAAIRGERDMAVANAIGSNLFNLLAVLGVTALVAPRTLEIAESVVRVDMLVMLAAAVACLPLFALGYTLERWEGAAFLAFYGAYGAWLVLDASDHAIRDRYSFVVMIVALPLTVITLGVIGWRTVRGRTSAGPCAPGRSSA